MLSSMPGRADIDTLAAVSRLRTAVSGSERLCPAQKGVP